MINESIISLINYLNGVTTSTQSDSLGLVRFQSLTNGNTLINFKVYNYFLPNETNKISSLVSQEVKTTKVGNKTSDFTYDVLGNMTTIKTNNVIANTYAYDERGFLKSETGPQNTYIYDYSGNILTISGTRNVSFKYETNNTDTLKRLLQAGSEYIDYLGTSLLPSSIYTKSSSEVPQNIANLSWQGKRLLSYINPTNTCLYTYDHQGFRLSKNINGTETKYTYFNGLLTLERYNNKTIRYRYDANSLLYGFTYEDGNNITEFFYDRDVLGVINGIYDSFGNLVVTYIYDAYGNIEAINDTSSIGIGTINKIRYKGYYYDEETSFYYCHTRYYVPRWTRWLSGDDVAYLEPSTPSGLNLFVYCKNNPVMFINLNGEIPVRIKMLLLPKLTSLNHYPASTSYVSNNLTDRRELIWLNHVKKTHETFSLNNNQPFGILFGNLSYTISRANENPGLFYTYSDLGLDDSQFGGGINIANSIGAEVFFSTTGNIGFGFQFTPWLHGSAQVGVSGLTISLGIDIGKTAHDLSISLGWGSIGLILLASIAVPSTGIAAIAGILILFFTS